MKAKQVEEVRASQYLVRRAEALHAVVQFFLADSHADGRQLRFLAQSDFWEWELDNLLYSFTNFAERSRAWQSTDSALEQLADLGFLFDARTADKLRRRAPAPPSGATVAPLELLRIVVDAWNRLISTVEQKYVSPMQRKSRDFGIQTRTDLAHLRRPVPQLELPEDLDG